jgi:hypothetical protein
MFVPGKPFQPRLLLVSKAGALPSEALSGAPFYGRLRALPTNIRLDWKKDVCDKHLLQKLVNYGQKKFYNIGTWQNGQGSDLGHSVVRY